MEKEETTLGLVPVFVIWDDAFSIDEWSSLQELKEAKGTLVHSVGFLVQRTEEYVVLALNHDTSNEAFSCIMYIPTNMVKAVVPLDK